MAANTILTPAQWNAKLRKAEVKAKVGWAMYYGVVDEMRAMYVARREMMRNVRDGAGNTDDPTLIFLKKSFLDMMDTLKAFHECPICIEELTKTTTAVPNCGHLVCKSCYGDTRLRICPICRLEYKYKKAGEAGEEGV